MPTAQPIRPALTASELAALIAERPDLRLLDVRTPGEFEAVHLRGAYNVPLDTIGEHASAIRAGVRSPIVLICQSDWRSRQAEAILRRAGMSDLHILEGGMNAWLAAGFPVERGRARLSLERQVRIVAGTLAAAGGMLAATVHPLFGLLPAFIGGGLVFAGVTNTCALAMLLAKLPYNRSTASDIRATVQALIADVALANPDRAPSIKPA